MTISTDISMVWPSPVWTPSAKAETPSTDDHQLAQAAARGDMQAFEEIFLRYNRRVYSLCLRMTRNATEAEDLTQETFTRLFKVIGSFRGESSFITWLHRLTVNQVLMHFRKGVVRREHTTGDGKLPEPKMESRETQSQMLATDRLALEKAIAELAPGYRAVLILHDVEGYEHTEIAEMRGISVGTSKSQLHKARLKLRQLLQREFEPQEQNLVQALDC